MAKPTIGDLIPLGSDNNYADADKAKVDAIPENPEYTDTKYSAGTNVSISGTTISATDTKTTINGKTGAIAKADIVALGIPSQDTVYSHPASHPASMITDLPTGKKVARFVVGTSTAGWTAADCDYLCDGTADQTEINAAITALPATGGEVVLLDGTYNITAKINVNKDNVSIVGNGKSTCLSKKWNATDGTITVTSKYCSIRNIYFYGNNSQPFATNAGIYLSVGADSSIINNNWFENFECGVHVLSSHNSISSNVCHVLPIDGYGILLKSSSDNAIINNVCNGGNYGIYLDSSNNNTVTSNTCNNNNYGIYLSSSNNNTVTGNTCNNNDRGIYLNSSSNNTVTGNTCIRGTGLATDYTSSQHTIQLNGTANNYNLISNNNCMGKAVTNGGGTGNTLVNNKFDAS